MNRVTLSIAIEPEVITLKIADDLTGQLSDRELFRTRCRYANWFASHCRLEPKVKDVDDVQEIAPET